MKQETKILHLMGTVIQLKIEHEEPSLILEKATRYLKDFEKRFSANSMTSDLSAININSGKKAIPVAEDLFDLIQIGTYHSLQENSFLNIAIGPLVQKWRIGFSDARVPDDEAIMSLLQKIDPKQIVINPVMKTVYLNEEGMSLDLGALAKGYCADQLVEMFKKQNVRSALINLGGNLVVMGKCPTRKHGKWHVGIQNPNEERNHASLVLKVNDCSVVTSGIYERQLEVDGKKYHHILDPHTGYPVKTDVVSLTILSKASLDGEIWTTRLFGKNSWEIIPLIDEQPGIEGIIITDTSKYLYSKNIKKYV